MTSAISLPLIPQPPCNDSREPRVPHTGDSRMLWKDLACCSPVPIPHRLTAKPCEHTRLALQRSRRGVLSPDACPTKRHAPADLWIECRMQGRIGLCARVQAKLTAHTFGLYLNYLLGRPLLALIDLAVIQHN